MIGGTPTSIQKQRDRAQEATDLLMPSKNWGNVSQVPTCCTKLDRVAQSFFGDPTRGKHIGASSFSLPPCMIHGRNNGTQEGYKPDYS